MLLSFFACSGPFGVRDSVATPVCCGDHPFEHRISTMSLADALRRGRRAGIALARRKPTTAEKSPSAVPSRPRLVAASEKTPRLRDWIGIFAMGVGQFMAIMDVQIVTS